MEMEPVQERRSCSYEIPDVVLKCVMNYIDDPSDRHAASLASRKWHRIDGVTRKHLTIDLCYSATAARLIRRFPMLRSLTLKGKPRASMFDLIRPDWGGYAGPWMQAIAENLHCLTCLHLRRMVVSDADLRALARFRGLTLASLKLDKCSGFSTDALRCLARSCLRLKELTLEDSAVVEHDGEWVRDLAAGTTVLQVLNFYTTDLRCVSPGDLQLLAEHCPGLLSLKISDCDVSKLDGVFRMAGRLEEFCGGSFEAMPGAEALAKLQFSNRLCSLGLTYMGNEECKLLFPFAARLKKLDLQYAFLNTEGHCELIRRCPNLEVLKARNVIGDRGLAAVAKSCRKLREIRIERGEDEGSLEDEHGFVSHRGLEALADGCREIEKLAVYAMDIANSALVSFGRCCKRLRDFRLVLLDREERVTELPLDRGVQALLEECTGLERFALYLRPGGLTDEGMRYIGKFGRSLRWLLLGFAGESDKGLLELSAGCPRLEKLEMRGCWFSERALGMAVVRLRKLRLAWVQGFDASEDGRGLLHMVRPYWNVEFNPPKPREDGSDGVEPAQVLAYYSLAGPRSDHPAGTVILGVTSSHVGLCA